METMGKKNSFFIFFFKYLFLVFFFLKKKDFSQLPDNVKDYISTLQNDNQSLQAQLNNLTAVVDFADSTKIAEIADLKQRHQQELATINILMEGNLIRKNFFKRNFVSFRNNS
jgi:hypothetical protein